MWTLIAIGSIVVGVWLVYTVMVKKFPQLKLIDLSTLAKERHAEVKTRIIRDRFNRSMGALSSKTSAVFGGLRSRMKRAYERMEGRLKQMEKNIDRQKAMEPEEVQARIGRLLHEAETLIRQDHLEEAEAGYIEVLRLDSKHVEAYRGLADLYVARKMYEQAKETLEYLVRINAEDDRAFGRLGDVEALLGDYQGAEARYLKSITLASDPALYRVELGRLYFAAEEPMKAFEQFRMALEIEPYNPKYLDYFLETSILIGDVKSAQDALEVLETANPENQKLADFRTRIERMRQQTTTL